VPKVAEENASGVTNSVKQGSSRPVEGSSSLVGQTHQMLFAQNYLPFILK